MVRLALRLFQRRVPEYWKRHTERAINFRSKPARYVPLRGWVGEDKRLDWLHTRDHPRTVESQMLNLERRSKEVELIEPIKEWTVQIGDRVEILVGRHKGKHGLVKEIVYERNWVFVEGLHLHYQLNGDTGKLVPEEMPLDVSSEIALVDPVTDKAATKAEWRYTEAGRRVRVLLPSGAILNPQSSEMLADGISPETYIANPRTDTTEKDLKNITYQANLKTFEDDIMDSMEIAETRKRGKTYWY